MIGLFVGPQTQRERNVVRFSAAVCGEKRCVTTRLCKRHAYNKLLFNFCLHDVKKTTNKFSQSWRKTLLSGAFWLGGCSFLRELVSNIAIQKTAPPVDGRFHDWGKLQSATRLLKQCPQRTLYFFDFFVYSHSLKFRRLLRMVFTPSLSSSVILRVKASEIQANLKWDARIL